MPYKWLIHFYAIIQKGKNGNFPWKGSDGQEDATWMSNTNLNIFFIKYVNMGAMTPHINNYT